MAYSGENYTTALKSVRIIRELMVGLDVDFDAAQAYYDDPGNALLCGRCGWVASMACSECSGCGCDRTCTGYRHEMYMDDEELRDRNACDECGGDSTSPYGCGCGG